MLEYKATARPDLPVLLALDFGGTKLAAAVVAAGDDQGRCRDHWVAREEAASPADRTALSDLRIMGKLMEKVLAASQGPLAATGISFGGPVAVGRREVVRSYHVPGWEGVPLSEWLEDELGAPAFMDNDGNTAALGEHRYGAGQGAKSLLYITVSTGVGGGWILNGEIWGGADGVAGEIGHLVVDPQGPTCPCGRRGCVEVMASGLGIALRAGEWLATRPGEGAVLRELEAEGRAASSLAVSAEMVAHAAAQGDELAWQVLEVSARALGKGIGGAANLMNPQLVLLGGGVTKAGERWWQAVRQSARESALPGIRVEIEPAALGDDAPLWGAIALAQDGLWADPPESDAGP